MNNPLVSVIVPSYNQSDFLNETLNSVLSQTFDDWECIIINDGSTDETEKVAESYCLKDKRFRYFKKENGGLSLARNKGIELASGKFIQFLDSDDIIDSRKFEIQMKGSEENEADVYISDYNFFEGDITTQFENRLSRQQYDLSLDGFLYKWLNLTFVIPIHCGLFKRQFIITNKLFFDERVKAIEDWIFWCSFMLHKPRLIHNSAILAHYRIHEKSMSKDLQRMYMSYIKATYIVDELVPEEKKNEFRNNISEILIKSLSVLLGEQETTEKANSIDYKVGYILLLPFHKISSAIKKTLANLRRSF